MSVEFISIAREVTDDHLVVAQGSSTHAVNLILYQPGYKYRAASDLDGAPWLDPITLASKTIRCVAPPCENEGNANKAD